MQSSARTLVPRDQDSAWSLQLLAGQETQQPPAQPRGQVEQEKALPPLPSRVPASGRLFQPGFATPAQVGAEAWSTGPECRGSQAGVPPQQGPLPHAQGRAGDITEEFRPGPDWLGEFLLRADSDASHLRVYTAAVPPPAGLGTRQAWRSALGRQPKPCQAAGVAGAVQGGAVGLSTMDPPWRDQMSYKSSSNGVHRITSPST